MARGITETDVWQACDALLLEGARPTIERVRQKIGRGSPNTVSPHLDAWFKHLGGRIKDPGAFAAPPALPDPVHQAAQHFWEVALAQTRLDFDDRLQEGMAAAVANVEAEKERAAVATAAAFEANARANRSLTDLAKCNGELELEKRAHAATAAHLSSVTQQVDEMKLRLQSQAGELVELRAQLQCDVQAANERSAAAERRAALEIDSERMLRAKAEKRGDALERRLEANQAELHAGRAQHMASNAQLQAELAHARDALGRALEARRNAESRGEQVASGLAEAQQRAEVAQARATLAEQLLERLRPAGAAATPKSKRAKATPD